jgi:beta-lactamase regulating signal transducer with metallopeptidase domain
VSPELAGLAAKAVEWVGAVPLAALGAAALQSSVVAALLLGIERGFGRRSQALRSGLVALALAKFAMPAWLAWPLLPALAAGAGTVYGPAPSPEPMAMLNAATLSAALVLLWALGTLIGLVRWAASHARIAHEAGAAEPCRDERALVGLRSAARRAGLRHSPALLVSARALAPFAMGVLRPAIILPAGWIARLSDTDLETILLHEAVHVRRRDVLRLELATLLGVVWWWNPVCRLAVARWRALIEDACDDHVLVASSAGSADYCGSLLRAARLAATPRVPDLAGAAGLGLHDFERRLRRLMDERFAPARRTHAASAMVLVAAGVLLLPFVGAAPGAGPGRIPSAPDTPAVHGPSAPRAHERHGHGNHASGKHTPGRDVHVHTFSIGP